MDILSVLKRHGHTTYTLAKEMKIKQSTLSNMLNGNPTVKSLKLMAEKMPCSVAEFFLDEMSVKDLEALLEIARERENQQKQESTAEQMADKMGAAHEVSTEGKQSPGDLPFKDEPVLTADVALICPHCHEAIKMGFIK